MTKAENERLKLIETELAYLRKMIEEFINDKRVEIHYHYSYDYDKMKDLIDYLNNKQNNK